MSFLFNISAPFLRLLPPERAHKAALEAIRLGLTPKMTGATDPRLGMWCFGLRFDNPLGVAAGFDKNAMAIRNLVRMGFGHVEIGTVTPKPQKGNPAPRVFRCPERQSIINRMGFPNAGMDAVLPRLRHVRAKSPAGVIGVNIGINKDTADASEDYRILASAFAPLADYLTVNVSSPNTPGLRDWQTPEGLERILQAVDTGQRQALETPKPVLVKFAPDLKEEMIPDLAQALRDNKAAGAICTNTTLARPETMPPDFAAHAGGLSGPPLALKANHIISQFYRHLQGDIPIIGVGGIDSAQSAYDKIRAGASLMQIYTGLVFHGPDLIPEILNGILQLLEQDRLPNLGSAIGADAREMRHAV